MRETFRVALQSRAGVPAPQVPSRRRGRALQLAVQTLTGVRRGSGYTAISLRLYAAALLDWAISRIDASLR
ncbi:hypothetical protein [Nostocoides sp. HKS02]|uniref:hypothetical protein n=1 Tax=Nostocoides sp. HKS02 TaxID=1813880 RepID=UPI0012B4F8A8|nr:hypothetical protein [Tetrasphaera sp. HKS02]QGN57957.1 hypothetical protein GKE56_08740 [Tetrasphaera sp. HKS02]